MNEFRVLWAIFCCVVLYSFGDLALDQFRRGRPHVASMSASYVLLCMSALILPPECDCDATPGLFAFRSWLLVPALVFGIVGLVDYYRRRGREQ